MTNPMDPQGILQSIQRRQMAETIVTLQQQITQLQRANGMTRGSIIGQPLDIYDADENLTMQVGQQYDGAYVAAPLVGPEPPIPTAPFVVPGLRSATVHWDGNWEATFIEDEDGLDVVFDDAVVAPMDFARVEIHASMNPDFEATSVGTLVGTIETPRGGEFLIPIPSNGADYTVKLVARSTAGKRSDASVGALVRASDIQTSDGIPPTESPTPIIIGQVGQVYLAWDDVDNADPVTYRIYANNSSDVPVIEANLIAVVNATAYIATAWRFTPAIQRIPYGTDTYFRVVASDADGDAPAGVVVAGRAQRASASDLNDGIISLLKLAPDAADAIADASSDATAAQASASQAIADAADAQATADGKARTYFQIAAPTGLTAADVGDMWFDTDDGNRMYRWSGTAWVVAQDQALSNAIKMYVQSRGVDLVTNGTAALGDNTNFSAFTLDKSDAPTGAAGSFDSPLGINGAFVNDEFIPVDPTRAHRLSMAVRQKGVAGARIFALVQPFDAYKDPIFPSMYMYIPGTSTTLAAPLNPGNTTITLTSSANWYGVAGKPAGGNSHWRSIAWWDYTDQGGKLWPPETFTRSNWTADLWSDGAITGNVITLRSPWTGPAKPAGTKLSNGSSGGTYMYVPGATDVVVPQTWTDYAASIVGTVKNGGGADFALGWPAGVGYCKVGLLANRNADGSAATTSKHSIGLVAFSPASAAQATADQKITTFYQPNVPTSVATGDLWVDTDDGNRLYRAAKAGANAISGGNWIDVRDAAIAASATSAASALAAAQAAQTAADQARAIADGSVRTYYATTPPWPNGSTQPDASLGDMWYNQTTGQAFRWNGTSWQVIADNAIGQALAAAQNAQTTADGKITTHFLTAPPWVNGSTGHAVDSGDIWYDTDNGNKTYYWDHAALLWKPLPVGLGGLGTDVTARALGSITTTSDESAPTSPKVGDLWIDTGNDSVLHRWDGASWVTVRDEGINWAIGEAAQAANMADSKMRIFYEPKAVSGNYPASNPAMTTADVGDLWFRADEGNKPYRWTSGGLWLAFTFGQQGIQQTDGIVPATSPACDVTGGIRCVFLRWTPITNADPVRYRVYGSKTNGFTPGPANFITETSATALTVQRVPGVASETFDPEITVDAPAYFKIIAADDDGPSTAIGAQGSGSATRINSPDIAAEAITTDLLAAGTVLGRHLSGQIVSGSIITTGGIDFSGDPESNPDYGQVIGQRVELRPEGLRLIDSAENILVSFPTNITTVEESEDPERPYIKGTLEAERLIVSGGASFQTDQNRIEKGGALRLASATTAPTDAPAITHEYDRLPLQRVTTGPADPLAGNLGVFALETAQITCWGWHPEWGCWMIAQKRPGGVRIWHYLTDGTIAKDFANRDYCYDLVGWSDITALWGYEGDIGGGAIGLYGGTWWISGKTGATGAGAWNMNKYVPQNTALKPVAFWSETSKTLFLVEGNVLVGTSRVTRSRRMTLSTATGATATTVGYTDMPATANSAVQLAAVTRGSFDLASDHFVWSWINNATKVMVAGPTYAPVDSHRFPVATTGFGHLWDGSNFWLLGSDGYLYKYANWTWTDAADYLHAAITWYDGDGTTHETKMGNINSYALRKRAKVRLTLPRVPDLGGVDDPNKWRLYMVRAGAAKPDRTQMIYQTEGGSADDVTVIVMTSPGTAGAGRPPAVGNFPDSNPAILATDAKSAFDPLREPFYVDGNGKGRWDYLIPPGTLTMYANDTPLPGYSLPEIVPGWLLCRGDVVSRAAYPALFTAIQTTFNIGGEQTTEFRLPDGMKRSPVGASPVAGHPLGWTDGRDISARALGHSHTTNISHTHTFSATTSTFTHSVVDTTLNGGTLNRLNSPAGHNHTVSGTTVAGGSTAAASNSYTPNVFTINYIIKT